MAIGGRKVALDPARDTLINVNALGDPVPSARFMGGREFELVRRGHDGFSEADVEAVLARGVLLLPSVETQSGPFQGREASWSEEGVGGRGAVRGAVVLSGDDDGDLPRDDRGGGAGGDRGAVREEPAVSADAGVGAGAAGFRGRRVGDGDEPRGGFADAGRRRWRRRTRAARRWRRSRGLRAMPRLGGGRWGRDEPAARGVSDAGGADADRGRLAGAAGGGGGADAGAARRAGAGGGAASATGGSR